MTAPRVRFAPSPTGYLHVGGARTALFNWLFARHTGGTSCSASRTPTASAAPRSTPASSSTGWPGWASPGTRARSSRASTAPATRPTPSGCSPRARRTAASAPARSSTRSAPQAGAGGGGFRYDRRCYRLSPAEVAARVRAGTPSTIRFLLQDDEIAWEDAVHGRISFQGRDLDDFVILRSDGTAIYNLAVVSDDIAMRITHVIRGDDHISNTPKQIALYRALGHEPPVFAHVPMILGTTGRSCPSATAPRRSATTRSRGSSRPPCGTSSRCSAGRPAATARSCPRTR